MPEYVYDTHSDMVNGSSIRIDGDVLRTLGYGEAGDGGAAVWVYHGTTEPTSNSALTT